MDNTITPTKPKDRGLYVGYGQNDDFKEINLGGLFSSPLFTIKNDADKWLEEHLVFTRDSDGQINFIGAIDDKTKQIYMLPQKISETTSVSSEVLKILPKDWMKKIEDFANPSILNGWRPTSKEELLKLGDYFPRAYLAGSDKGLALFGHNYKSKEIQNNKVVEITYCEDCEYRFTKKGLLTDPYEMLAENISLYMTKKNTKSIQEIPTYSTDMNKLAMKHLDLSKWCEKGDWSLWREFFENREISGDKLDLIMGLIWAIFDESFKTRQVIYLYDAHGKSGKSVLLNALKTPFKEMDLVGVYQEKNSDGFTNESIWNKRLLLMPDLKDSKMVKYGRFHNLTGDDDLFVNRKNKKAITVHPMCKIFAIGNILPEIDLQAEHETSRFAIFTLKKTDKVKKLIEHEDGTSGDPDFEQRLIGQLKAFLFACKEIAYKINPMKCNFDTSCLKEDMMKCADASSIFFEDFMEDELIFGDEYEMLVNDLKQRYQSYIEVNKKSWVASDSPDYKHLEEHLTKIYPEIIKRKSQKRNENRGKWVFPGVMLKSEDHDKVEDSLAVKLTSELNNDYELNQEVEL